MSQRELLVLLAHAQACTTCREKLLQLPESVLRGRSLTSVEKELVMRLTDSDFLTPEMLARTAGIEFSELDSYVDHPLVRLRHF